MRAFIEHVGADVMCRSEGGTPSELRLDGEKAGTTLEGWAGRYDQAVSEGNDPELLAIGTEMFKWLDENDWASAWAKAPGPRTLEVRASDLDERLSRALLDAPWELLARDDHGHLAIDSVQLFEVARRIGAEQEVTPTRHSDLQLMFMAAAPAGASVLDFEAEEAAILDVTSHLPLHLVVEESGAAKFLKERLKLEGPFEALHLSCHGDIHPKRGPVLALEDEFGDVDFADAGEIAGLLGDPERTPLVFLSACRTAETGNGDAGNRGFEPFARELTRAGVANVLGWDGSVYDADASLFAQTFYEELAGRTRVGRAAAMARQALLRSRMDDPDRGQHWHLARLYLGPRGGGALTGSGMPKRKLANTAYQDQFLDKERSEVPVASRAEFVGRRREVQTVLRAFRDGATGVLIHGMGNLGKSSLAARISSRLTSHGTVVIFGRYDAVTVFDRVVGSLPPAERAGVRETWRDAVAADEATLGEALEDLFDGPDARKVLLVVDDLERILEKPEQSDRPTPVQKRYGAVMRAVLTAFRKASSPSHLLLTSRYRFTLPDGKGLDLAEDMVRVPLRPMEKGDRIKQLRAAARALDRPEADAFDKKLADRALRAAGGNPGLQAALMTPILGGETEAAEQALEAIEHYQKTGAPPDAIRELVEAGAAQDEANAIVAFFKRMAFDTYRDALTEPQARMLSAACVFAHDMPIPRPALEAAGTAAGVDEVGPALDRLLGLGLVDEWGVFNDVPQAAANPLARPLAADLDDELEAQVGGAALPALENAWRDSDGRFRWDPRSLEVARLALSAPDPDPDLLSDAAEAAGRYLFQRENQGRLAHNAVLLPALAKLGLRQHPPSPGLLMIACDCASFLGETEVVDAAVGLLEKSEVKGFDHASGLLRVASRRGQQGDMDAAESALKEAAEGFLAVGAERDWAIARGEFADILQTRGEFDEAMRIRLEEELPVYERLNDLHSIAVTQGAIADIHAARGDLDEALRLRAEEQLPVFERLSKVRDIAVTKGKIADIHVQRGNLDEALRIRKEEQLPVYERISDVRGMAVALINIGDIHSVRGDLDEALRLYQEEALPVYQRLDDARQTAVTMGKIADVLMERGDLAEALRIRTEEQVPVYKRLHLVRDLAVTQGKIADILTRRGEEGDIDEALRLHTDEALPVYERLNDARSKAVTQGKIAGILMARGQLDEALALHEERLPVAQDMGDIDSVAHILLSTSNIRLIRGDHKKEGGLQKIFEDLAAAFGISLKLDRPDFIGEIGLLLGQVLAMGGAKDEGLEILGQAEKAFERIDFEQGVEQARKMQGLIKESM